MLIGKEKEIKGSNLKVANFFTRAIFSHLDSIAFTIKVVYEQHNTCEL